MKKLLGKRGKIGFVVIFAVIFIFLTFYLTRPTVVYLSSSMPDGYNDKNIRFFSGDYRKGFRVDSADIAIVSPSAHVPDTKAITVLIGRAVEGDENPDSVLFIDEEAMWKVALSDERTGIVYAEDDGFASGLAENLAEGRGNVYLLPYQTRISGANVDSVMSRIVDNEIEVLFLLTPSSSLRLFDEELPDVVMDFRDGAAMERIGADKVVGIDYGRSIENILSGDYELSYALLSP